MKNKLKIMVITIVALGLFVSCANNKNNNEDNINNNIEIDNNITIVKENETINFDLDGDGKDEKISYTLKNDDGEEMYFDGTVTIDDKEYKATGGNSCEEIVITKLDNTKSNYYILIGDYGPSSDYTTEFITYKNKKIIYVGTCGGLYNKEFEYNDGIRLNGDGTLVAPERANIVQTWWYDANYEIKNEKLTLIKEDFYKTNFTTETLIDYEFYLEPNIKSDKVLIEARSIITMTGTDDKEWTRIEYLDLYGQKQEAYFRVDFFCQLDENLSTQDLFKDLIMAD